MIMDYCGFKMLYNLAFHSMKLYFIDKYITTDQTFFPIEIHSAQIHQHKRTCQKKSTHLSISISLNFQ
jgi:hypothetical protein